MLKRARSKSGLVNTRHCSVPRISDKHVRSHRDSGGDSCHIIVKVNLDVEFERHDVSPASSLPICQRVFCQMHNLSFVTPLNCQQLDIPIDHPWATRGHTFHLLQFCTFFMGNVVLCAVTLCFVVVESCLTIHHLTFNFGLARQVAFDRTTL